MWVNQGAMDKNYLDDINLEKKIELLNETSPNQRNKISKRKCWKCRRKESSCWNILMIC